MNHEVIETVSVSLIVFYMPYDGYAGSNRPYFIQRISRTCCIEYGYCDSSPNGGSNRRRRQIALERNGTIGADSQIHIPQGRNIKKTALGYQMSGGKKA